MSIAAVVLATPPSEAPGRGRSARPGPRRPAPGPLTLAVTAALGAAFDEVVVVLGDEAAAAGLPEDCTLLLDESPEPSQCSALRAALDWCSRNGHVAIVVAAVGSAGRAVPSVAEPAAWRDAAGAPGGPVAMAIGRDGGFAPLRIDAEAWPLLPLGGELAALWRARPELVVTFEPGGR